MKATQIMAALGITFLFLLGALLVVSDADARGPPMEVERGMGKGGNMPDARIRAVHLSPDAPAVDIWVDGSKVITDLAFGEYTGYLTVPSNKGNEYYNIQVVPTGLMSPVVIDADLRLKPNHDYTVVAIGRLADIEPLVIEDNNKGGPNMNSLVRFAHTSPDAPSVDIALQDGPVLFSDVSFGEVEEYLEVSAGSYDLEVRLAGTETVVLSVDDVSLMKGTQYTIFATGLVSPGEGEPSLSALLLKDRSK